MDAHLKTLLSVMEARHHGQLQALRDEIACLRRRVDGMSLEPEEEGLVALEDEPEMSTEAPTKYDKPGNGQGHIHI